MPFYFRKSIGSGPFRLNISGRGVGVSVGVKGLRVGTGPRGAYVRAGRGGFYYQQYLSAYGRKRSLTPSDGSSLGESIPVATLPSGTPVELIDAEQATPDSFIAELNKRRRAFRWSGMTFAITALLFFFTVHGQSIYFILFAMALIGSIVLRLSENRSRMISVMYDLDDANVIKFDTLGKAFAEAGSSSCVWRVVTQTGVDDGGKRHAGAVMLLDRALTRIDFGATEVKTNVRAPSVALPAGRVFFLPDRVLVVCPTNVFSVKYSELKASGSSSRFRETDAKPPDATLVGTTWAYVNKNGTPDKRFSHNRQIPIFEYSEVSFESATLSFLLQFSKRGVSVPLAMAVRRCATV